MSDFSDKVIAMATEPEFARAVLYVQRCLERLEDALAARGEETYWYDKREYQGFYAIPKDAPELKVYVGFFPRAGAHYECSPVFVQLVGTAFTKDVLKRMQARWAVFDSRIFGWIEGAMVPVALRVSKTVEEQTEILLQEIDKIRTGPWRGVPSDAESDDNEEPTVVGG